MNPSARSKYVIILSNLNVTYAYTYIEFLRHSLLLRALVLLLSLLYSGQKFDQIIVSNSVCLSGNGA
jgi:hypothetical protein